MKVNHKTPKPFVWTKKVEDILDKISHCKAISEHASPVALTGGVDAGGQNIYVAHLARRLAALGYEVDVFTRRDDDRAPEVLNRKSSNGAMESA